MPESIDSLANHHQLVSIMKSFVGWRTGKKESCELWVADTVRRLADNIARQYRCYIDDK